MTNIREGGCLCGNVRYTIPWPPIATATCQCLNCQKQSGSSISVLAVVPTAALQVTGELSVYEDRGDSGGAVLRNFCGNCGSPILSDVPALKDQGIVFIKAGTLDDRSGLDPKTHYFCDSAQDWMVLPEGGVQLARQ